MTECGKCGACCERFYYSLTPEETIRRAEGGEGITEWQQYDAQFVRYYWHGSLDEHDNIVYTCDAYDPVARSCTQHENRPSVCRGFPWYGGEPAADVLRAFKGCSFWRDIPLDLWPDDVTIDRAATPA